MKKAIAILVLFIACLQLTSCSKKVELTTTNASDYLKTSVLAANSGLTTTVNIFGSPAGGLYPKISLNTKVNPTINNCTFNDVIITGTITGQYLRFPDKISDGVQALYQKFSVPVSIDLDLGGSGEDSYELTLPPHYLTSASYCENLSFEITAIQGTVSVPR